MWHLWAVLHVWRATCALSDVPRRAAGDINSLNWASVGIKQGAGPMNGMDVMLGAYPLTYHTCCKSC